MNCERCGSDHDGTFGSGRFCSRSCANLNPYTEERRSKLRATMKTASRWYKGGVSVKIPCDSCGKLIRNNPSKRCITCLRKTPEWRKTMSASMKGKTGGYRPNSGWGHFKKEKYKGIWMDSGWETTFAKRLDELNVVWERGHAKFKYAKLDGTIHTYSPDFYLKDRNVYIEINGYPIADKEEKLKLVTSQNVNLNLVVLTKLNEIKSFK